MRPEKPTESELEILQVLWKRGPATVREVLDELADERGRVYTTVLKLLQIMHEKGLVKRDESFSSEFLDLRIHPALASSRSLPRRRRS